MWRSSGRSPCPYLQADFSALWDGLFTRANVLTIGGEDGDELAASGLQADFSVIIDGLFVRAECAYYW